MNNILEIIVMYAPAIFAILSEIGVVLALIKKISAYFQSANAAVKELKESAEYTELKYQMKTILKENHELKVKLNTLLEQLTHVKVEDDVNEDN